MCSCGCQKPVYARGLCSACFRSYRRAGLRPPPSSYRAWDLGRAPWGSTSFDPCPRCVERSCERCGTKLTGIQRRWCSKRCHDIARGSVREKPLPERVCALDGCEVVFVPVSERQRCCCELHGKKLWKRTHDDPRHKWYGSSFAQRRRIGKRDGWVCWLCLETVDPDEQKWAWKATIDHVVPRGDGGTNDDSNLRLAHMWCNNERRDGLAEKEQFFADMRAMTAAL